MEECETILIGSELSDCPLDMPRMTSPNFHWNQSQDLSDDQLRKRMCARYQPRGRPMFLESSDVEMNMLGV